MVIEDCMCISTGLGELQDIIIVCGGESGLNRFHVNFEQGTQFRNPPHHMTGFDTKGKVYLQPWSSLYIDSFLASFEIASSSLIGRFNIYRDNICATRDHLMGHSGNYTKMKGFAWSRWGGSSKLNPSTGRKWALVSAHDLERSPYPYACGSLIFATGFFIWVASIV